MQDKKNLLHFDETDHFIGKNPLSIDINSLEESGHKNEPLAQIIRKKCLDCCGFQTGEVRKCIVTDCVLWPYRMGKNPFLSAKRKKLGMAENDLRKS